MSNRITRKSVLSNRKGQGKVFVISSDNQALMERVFRENGLSNLSGQRLNHAVAFFNRAFAKGRTNNEQNVAWFRSLVGL